MTDEQPLHRSRRAADYDLRGIRPAGVRMITPRPSDRFSFIWAAVLTALPATSCTDAPLLNLGSLTSAGEQPGHILFNCDVRGQRALDVMIQGHGRVQLQDESFTGRAHACVEPGAAVVLSAFPDERWTFAGFSGDFAWNQPDLPILVEQDTRLTATFEPIRSSALPQLLAPFPAGMSALVLQGPFGPYTHGDDYAWDFQMPVGTPVLAAREGVVIDLREDQPSHSLDDPVREGPANFVMLDHGDGLLSRYVHLDENGVLVEIGDSVVLGEVIGLSGNSGLSFEPHLHFETRQTDGAPRPTGLAESGRDDGVAQEGDHVRSRNRMIRAGSSQGASARASGEVP